MLVVEMDNINKLFTEYNKIISIIIYIINILECKLYIIYS